VALACGALAFGYVRSAGSGSVTAVLILAAALVGVLTAADRPDRAGLVRAGAWCAAGVLLGSLPSGAFHASVLILVFVLGRGSRMVQLERGAAEARAAAAIAHERAQIARDLHDVIAHSLGVVIVQVQAAERVMDADPAGARAALQSAAAVGRDALGEMHRMVGVMRGGGDRRDGQPSLGDLRELIEQVRSAGTDAHLQMAGGRELSDLAPGMQLAAYRIVQEALTNVSAHAAGAKVEVRVALVSGGLEVEVTDAGGQDRKAGAGGFGIEGMRERAALYGGTLEAGPRPTGGFAVKAWLPMRPA